MSQVKLKSMFDRYSKNWSMVKSHPNVYAEPNVDNVFVCPICFGMYSQDAVSAKSVSCEHIPPKKLGGKIRTITCKQCNNWAGTTLDNELLEMANFAAFLAGEPDVTQNIKFYVNDEGGVPATVNRPQPDRWIMTGHPKRSNPRDMEKVRSILEVKNLPFNFTLSFTPHKNRHPEAALLRIAYLWAFSVFGYSFLLNPNLGAVRHQIKYPENTILPSWGIAPDNLPDEALGINFVVEPKELRSFLIVFDLTVSHTKIRRGVNLPGPNYPGLDIYSWLLEHGNEPVTVKTVPVPKDFDFNESPFETLDMWEYLTQNDQP